MKRSLKRKIDRRTAHVPGSNLTIARAIKHGTETTIAGTRYIGRARHVTTGPLKPDGSPGLTFITQGIPFVRLTRKPHLKSERVAEHQDRHWMNVVNRGWELAFAIRGGKTA